MLKFFRDQKNSWLMKGILTLTALSFVSLFGMNRFTESFPDEGKTIFQVAGKKTTVAQYVNEVQNNLQAMTKALRKPFTMKDAVESGLPYSIFNRMVSRAVMAAATDSMHLAVSEQTVRDTVKKMPLFTDYDGSFSLSAFKQYLSDSGLTEKRFIADLFLDLRAQQMTQAAAAATVEPTDMLETVYRIRNEKRVTDVFTITPSELKVAGKPTKADEERLYKEMSDELIAPEYRSFTVLRLTLGDVAKKIKITEEELQDIFNENKDAYAIEEIRDVDQMLFTTKDEADKAYAALKKGQDFMAVAKKFANQTEDQTKLGELTPSTATGDWADVVFAAQKGEVVAPVQTAFGWQILRVNKITPRVEKKFKDVRDEIEQKLIASLAYDALTETAVALDDRFGAGETIEEIAAATGYPMTKYTMLDTTGTDENGKKADVSATVLTTVFAMDAGRESPMTEEGNDYFVVRVDDIRDPALKTIEKSKKEIKAAWIAEQQRNKAQELAKSVADSLNKGVAVQTIAKKSGVKYKRLDTLTRRSDALPATATYRLFNSPVGEVISVSTPTDTLIVKAIKSVPANPKKDVIGLADLRRMMQEQTAAEKADAVLADYGTHLNVKVDRTLLKNSVTHMTKSAQDNNDDY